MYDRVGVAMVGTGFIGPIHVEALKRLGVRVKGVLGSSPAKSARARAAFGLEQAYRSYDAILSGTSAEPAYPTFADGHREVMLCDAVLQSHRTQSWVTLATPYFFAEKNMKLGFVSAILPDLSLDEVVALAAEEGYDCVELMCWPKGKAERRYAGVTHLDVTGFGKKDATRVNALMAEAGVAISGLGYYPNPLTPDEAEATVYTDHIKKVIRAAALLGVGQMNTFIGRDWTKSVEANWPRFKKVWKPLIRYAEKQGVRIGIENCPMYFTDDEWPGGKNLAHTPAIWRRMFAEIPSEAFGLNYDPSHMIWQHMDYLRPLRIFADRLFHIHAKDVRLDRHRLNEVGIMATPNEYHTPKLPGLGEVDWGRFISVLGDVGYDGAVCVEVEDRAYEGSLDARKASLRQSAAYLRQFIPKRP